MQQAQDDALLPGTEPAPGTILPDEDGFLYDCAFREHVRRRLNAEQMEQAEAIKAVAMAGKTINRAFEANLGRVGLTHTQFRTLVGIRYGGPAGIQMHAIAQWLGVTPRNVTAIVDALEAMGLVRRSPDARDRRAFIVLLTAAGEERAAAALRVNTADQKRIVGSLTGEERRLLRHLCLKLVQAAQAPAPARR